ncbi:3-dehydroquinate synthase [Halalkalibacterium halodurans]|uniref:3-dehydroquinate synthase n=1 Tax=Halalkalibacterium halodurans TaxID=86665 RepID=UPI001068235B|nr:3-dehydroquinate synthase [Halalkalibacterium halodurans]MED3646089.1 3-dehydroquinate synthase [Halalkalibacterium halodurans]TES57737.1 3-dehydroquinate synthase [Halalkalibacterium halodurans]
MPVLTVHTSSKVYDVTVKSGVLSQIGSYIAPLRPSAILIVTDDQVADLYLDTVKSSLHNLAPLHAVVLPNGEETKSFDNYYALQTAALEYGLDRKSMIIALGGGVIGDLAGFVAATYMRGIAYVQVPTTLLAHDSSVGGKVAINHPLGKNMIGAFHQPEAVLYDPQVFATLPEREWRSGFAEVVKHGLIKDAAFYAWLQKYINDFSRIQGEIAEELLLRSIQVKANIVAADEKEKGERALLNLGHTLGHAIEAELGYGKVTHGEAVVIGIIFAMKLSEKVYHQSLPIQDLEKWLKSLGYETRIPKGLDTGALIGTMKKDKKVERGVIRFVLLEEVGHAVIKEVDEQLIRELLNVEIEEETT